MEEGKLAESKNSGSTRVAGTQGQIVKKNTILRPPSMTFRAHSETSGALDTYGAHFPPFFVICPPFTCISHVSPYPAPTK